MNATERLLSGLGGLEDIKEEEQKQQQELRPQGLFGFHLSQFKEVLSTNLSFGAFFLLDKLVGGNVIDYIQNDKLDLLMKELERKGYIDEVGNPTFQGRLLWESIALGQRNVGGIMKAEKKSVVKKIQEDFDRWWAAYPPTDGFEYGGRKFEKSRGLRVDKDKCKELFSKLIVSEYTAEQVIEATKIDVETRKKASLNCGINNLKYFQNSATYLRQKSFDAFIEEISKKDNDFQTNNTIDI